MKKKHKNKPRKSAGFDPRTTPSDFYAGAPTERPLYQDRRETNMNPARKTARHHAVQGRRKETADPREKRALLAILTAAIVLVLLMIFFLVLWKVIKIYEDRIEMENQQAPATSLIMQDAPMVEDVDVSQPGEEESFAKRIEKWKEADRLVFSVDELLIRNNIAQAIERCNQALVLDPAHMGALTRLGKLYYEQEMYLEAVNTYIRLLNMDPSRKDLQLQLLKALDAHGSPEASIAVAQWYLDQNLYNEDVQRYLANAYFNQGKFHEAADAYERVLRGSPADMEALENRSIACMKLEQYDSALTDLKKLLEIKLRDPAVYKRTVVCHAQLGQVEETVQVLGKSAHLFGADAVAMWIQDPRLDPVRTEREFQIFADTVVTEEFRKYLEKMAQSIENKEDVEIIPQLDVPENQTRNAELPRPLQ